MAVAQGGIAAAISGPDDRQITEPKSVASASNPNAGPVAVEDLFVTRLIHSAALSPAGTEVAVTRNLTGRTNLWKVSTAGSWPVQLINSDDRQAKPMWSPNSRWIAYSQDKGGNELWDIYIVSREGGSPTNLTDTPDIREQHPVWSHDAKLIACVYKPKQASSYDFAVIDVATHKLRKLTEEKDPQQNWDVIAFSPDNKILYANRTYVGFDNGDVYAVDVANGRQTNLTPHEGKQLNIGTDVSPDGTTRLMTSNQKSGYPNSALLDVATKKLIWAMDTQWEVTSGAFSRMASTSHTPSMPTDAAHCTWVCTCAGWAARGTRPGGLASAGLGDCSPDWPRNPATSLHPHPAPRCA